LFCSVTAFLVAEPFEETEEKWLSSLENTRWLEYIRFVSLTKEWFMSFKKKQKQKKQKQLAQCK